MPHAEPRATKLPSSPSSLHRLLPKFHPLASSTSNGAWGQVQQVREATYNVCLFKFMCVCASVCVCVSVFLARERVYARVQLCARWHVRGWSVACLYVNSHKLTFIHACVYMHAYIRTCDETFTCIYMKSHAHEYIHEYTTQSHNCDLEGCQ